MSPAPAERAGLCRARRGAIGIIAALMSSVIFGMVGLTVDTARSMFVYERLISACDAGALAGAKVINTGFSLPIPQWMYDAQVYFNLNFPSGYFGVTSPANPTVTLSSDGTMLTVTETVTLPLIFGVFFAHPAPLPITAQSVARAGKVELAMVLDNTGSMNDVVAGDVLNKITLLKTAATSFVTSLTSLGNNNVRIAVVPFTMTVNVGTAYQSASWIDPSASYVYAGGLNPNTTPASAFQDIFSAKTNRFTVLSTLGTSWAGCIEMRPPVSAAGVVTHYDTMDIAANTSDPNSLFTPFFAPSEPKALSYPGNNNTYYFYNNYVNDYGSEDNSGQSAWRTQQADVRKYTRSGVNVPNWTTQSYNGYVLGPNAGCQGYTSGTSTLVTLQPLQRLTTSTATLGTEIAGMQPMGGTYLPVGLFWGWETISPNSVFPDAQLSYTDPGVTKVVILLTDGCNSMTNPNDTGSADACGNQSQVTTPSDNAYYDNDQSYYQSTGYIWQNRLGLASANPNPASDPNLVLETDTAAVANAQMLSMCANMKADGVQIYTIGIDAQGSSNPTLSACATAPNAPYYYSLPDPSSLAAVFQQIAQNLTVVRIVNDR